MNRVASVWRKVALPFLLCTLLVAAAHLLPALDQDALAFFVRGKGSLGVVLYIAITAAASALGVPRQGLSFAGGYVFGAAWGGVFATLGTISGCAVSFFLVRWLGRPFLSDRFAARMKRLDAFAASAPFTMTVIIRCLPLGNNALTNVLAGLSSIAPIGFLAGSLVGYLPQNLIFALLGSGIRVDPFWRVCLAVALFTLSVALGIMLFRRHRIILTKDGDESAGTE